MANRGAFGCVLGSGRIQNRWAALTVMTAKSSDLPSTKVPVRVCRLGVCLVGLGVRAILEPYDDLVGVFEVLRAQYVSRSVMLLCYDGSDYRNLRAVPDAPVLQPSYYLRSERTLFYAFSL